MYFFISKFFFFLQDMIFWFWIWKKRTIFNHWLFKNHSTSKKNRYDKRLLIVWIFHKNYTTVGNCAHGARDRYWKSLLTLNHDISVKKRDSAFLKIQLKSLWNSTSSDAQQIFFWLSENNTAREELKKKSRFSQILYLN